MRPDTKRALLDYREHGIEPGDFLRAVLCNSLIGALNNADQENTADLQEIVRFVNDELPWAAWGNLEKVKIWMKQRGFAGVDKETTTCFH